MTSRISLRVGTRLFTYSKRHFQTVSNIDDILHVSTSQIKRTLEYRGINSTEGFTCLITNDCPLQCQDRTCNKKFYINKTTGLFVCHSCGRIGPWSWLERRLLEPSGQPLAASQPLSSESLQQLSDNCIPVATAAVPEVRKCLADLNLNHVTTPMLAQLGACVDIQGSRLLLPLRGGPEDNVGAWLALSPGSKDRPKEEVLGLRIHTVTTSPLLLASAGTWSSPEAVLVPSAADFLALTSKSIPALCFAAGPKHLPQEVLPLLEQFSKITLWFGEHTATARQFAHKLSISRCYLVRPREGLSNAHEVIVDHGKKQQLLAIVNEAQAISHPAIIDFKQLREDVRSDLERGDLALGIQWSRFPKLNTILGGFRQGEVTVLSGPTGSGKTTFLSEYSLDLCQQGVNTLWGSFEIKNSRLSRTMLTQLAGERLEKSMHKFDEVADIMETLPLHFMAFHGQQPLHKVMEAVNHATYVHDLGHIIIDNVQFMLGASGDKFSSRFLKQDLVMEAFRNHATTYNCHVTLVIHPRKEQIGEFLSLNSVYGSAKATQEADNVLLLQSQMDGVLAGKKFLQVAKNRYTGALGSMLLTFDPESMSYSKVKTPLRPAQILKGHLNSIKIPAKISQ